MIIYQRIDSSVTKKEGIMSRLNRVLVSMLMIAVLVLAAAVAYQSLRYSSTVCKVYEGNMSYYEVMIQDCPDSSIWGLEVFAETSPFHTTVEKISALDHSRDGDWNEIMACFGEDCEMIEIDEDHPEREMILGRLVQFLGVVHQDQYLKERIVWDKWKSEYISVRP